VADAERRAVRADEYLAHVDGMVFGEDPRQGFFKGNAFLHPALKFKLDLPEGWQKSNTPGAVVAVSPSKDAGVQLSHAGKLSPEEAAKKFFGQQGVKPAQLASGAPPAHGTYFEADTEQGAVRGLVAFVPQDGATYQILGYTTAASLQPYDPTFRAVVASFGPLTDPAALAVQPARVQLVKAPRDMSLAEFNAQFPSTAPVEVVAIINEIAKDGRVPAGRTMKRVVGGNVPR
jgi:predicted Zn-dependent protease